MKILLDSYQVKAINIKDKNTLVVAAPGSGKRYQCPACCK